jgi:hypothetical protein
MATIRLLRAGGRHGPEDVYRKAYDGNAEGWARELGELGAQGGDDEG